MKMLRRSGNEGRGARRTARWWIVQTLAFLAIWAIGPLAIVLLVGPRLGVVGPGICFAIACAVFLFDYRRTVSNSARE
jgi:hypothetical protein